MVLFAIHGLLFIFSLPLLIISPSLWPKDVHPGFITCWQVRNNPTITAFVCFQKSRAHLRRCVFRSSVSKWETHQAQTFLRSKRFFRSVCTLPSDMPVQLAISLTDNHASCSITIFTAAMLALVIEVLGFPGRVSSSTENFSALKALT